MTRVTGWSRVPDPPARMIPCIVPPPSPAGSAAGRTRCVAGGAETRSLVTHRPDRLPPPAVVDIPGDGLAQARLEAFARPPAELAADLSRIHRIALVMAWAVVDKGDEACVRPVRRPRSQLVEQIADRGHDLQIGALAIAADIVALAGPALDQHG